jgi:hypothetical protein
MAPKITKPTEVMSQSKVKAQQVLRADHERAKQEAGTGVRESSLVFCSLHLPALISIFTLATWPALFSCQVLLTCCYVTNYPQMEWPKTNLCSLKLQW